MYNKAHVTVKVKFVIKILQKKCDAIIPSLVNKAQPISNFDCTVLKGI